MKYLQKSDLKLTHLVLVMGGVARLMNRNGAQCAVLSGRTQSDATNDERIRKVA